MQQTTWTFFSLCWSGISWRCLCPAGSLEFTKHRRLKVRCKTDPTSFTANKPGVKYSQKVLEGCVLYIFPLHLLVHLDRGYLGTTWLHNGWKKFSLWRPDNQKKYVNSISCLCRGQILEPMQTDRENILQKHCLSEGVLMRCWYNSKTIKLHCAAIHRKIHTGQNTTRKKGRSAQMKWRPNSFTRRNWKGSGKGRLALRPSHEKIISQK